MIQANVDGHRRHSLDRSLLGTLPFGRKSLFHPSLFHPSMTIGRSILNVYAVDQRTNARNINSHLVTVV